jgi:ATP-binding cassette, subfamily B (MDR/TAP), member 9
MVLSFIILFYISWALTLATLGSIAPLVGFGIFYGKAMKNT